MDNAMRPSKIYRIRPSQLKGEVVVPPSKSLAHRAVICSALAGGDFSRIKNIALSDDIKATIAGMEKLKNVISQRLAAGSPGKPAVQEKLTRPIEIDCNESGSTLRFLIPIAAALGGEYIFTGRGRLVERPLGPYLDIFRNLGIEYKTENGGLPLYFKGKLAAGTYELPGNISSQFVSGLLFALPLLDRDSQIVITTELESAPYVDLTTDTQIRFGISVCCEYNEDGNLCYYIKGRQRYKDVEYTLEGDYSQAAFWKVANYLGNEIKITGLREDSCQGDKEIVRIVEDFSRKNSSGNEIIIDASQIPDLVPIITVGAVFFMGRTRIIKAQRLRIKESDRLAAITEELSALGADIEELEDGLIINGTGKLRGGRVKAHNDHRIAMSLAVAATRCEDYVYLEGPECVEKSYPDFWDVYKRLGGAVDEFNVG